MQNWLLFSLLAPTFWAVANVLDSAARRHYIKNDYAFVWFVGITRLPLVAAFFIIFGFENPSWEAVAMMILGGMLWLLPFILYYRVFAYEEPSRAVLLMQLTPVFIYLFAYLILGETLTREQNFAFLLLLFGGFLASIREFKGVFKISRAALPLVLAAALWGMSDIIFKKYSFQFSSFSPAFAWYLFGSFLPSICIFFFPKVRTSILLHFNGVPKRTWYILLVDVVVGVSGSLFFAYALTLGKVSLSSVLSGIQPLLVIVFTFLLRPILPEVYEEVLKGRALIIKGASFAVIIVGLILLYT